MGKTQKPKIKSWSETVYILYRYVKACLSKAIYCLFGIFPIKKNKITVITNEGDTGYGCNAKAIVKELIRRSRSGSHPIHYEITWLVNDVNKIFPDEVRIEKNTFFNRARHLSTARVWIDTHRKPYGTRKRKHQLYIQAWHGPVGFKSVGQLRGGAFPRIAYIASVSDSSMADYFVSNSAWCTNVFRKGLCYSGDVIKTGSPRCDIFKTEKEELYKKIRNEYNLSQDTKILMYAPTLRGGTQAKERSFFVGDCALDFNKLIFAFERKFKGEWHLFLRMHPHLLLQFSEFSLDIKDGRMIDVSRADDMYELLAATDAFISDYSSSAFDAAYAGIPVFLYANDLDSYTKDRGLLWDITKLPFPFTETQDELLWSIENFDHDLYQKGLDALFAEIELLEDGHASERVADEIDYFMAYGKKDESCRWIVR